MVHIQLSKYTTVKRTRKEKREDVSVDGKGNTVLIAPIVTLGKSMQIIITIIIGLFELSFSTNTEIDILTVLIIYIDISLVESSGI